MKPIRSKFDPSLRFDQPGRLAMANAGPRTGTCQFFITEVPVPHLNDKHTIFGQVVEGQELVGKIARVPANASDKQATPVIMRTVVIGGRARAAFAGEASGAKGRTGCEESRAARQEVTLVKAVER